MTEIDLAKWLIRIVRQMEITAISAEVKGRAEQAGRAASASVWQEANPDDGVGGMSCNPYREREYDGKTQERLAKDRADHTALVEFTINKVLDKLFT